MDYTDYQFFDDQTYSVMKKEYEANPTDRKSPTLKIFYTLLDCEKYCLDLDGKLNIKLRTQLEHARNIINKQIENLSSLFNYKKSKEEIKHTNIFKFARLLTNVVQLYLIWLQQEEKEYYKKTASKSCAELLEIQNNILMCLETQKVILFKHM